MERCVSRRKHLHERYIPANTVLKTPFSFLVFVLVVLKDVLSSLEGGCALLRVFEVSPTPPLSFMFAFVVLKERYRKSSFLVCVFSINSAL